MFDPIRDRLYIAEALERFGGSFFKALGAALRHADSINAQKMFSAWPEISSGLYLRTAKELQETGF